MLTKKKILSVYEFEQNEYLIGTTYSIHSWDYDYQSIGSSLILNIKTLEVKLVFTILTEKYGLGEGSWFSLLTIHDVGTLKKLKKGLIRSLHKEKKSSEPFRRNGWYNVDSKLSELTLDQIIEKNITLQRILKLNKLKTLKL